MKAIIKAATLFNIVKYNNAISDDFSVVFGEKGMSINTWDFGGVAACFIECKPERFISYNVQKEGTKITVSGKILLDFVQTLEKDSEVEIHEEENRFVVTSQKSSLSLPIYIKNNDLVNMEPKSPRRFGQKVKIEIDSELLKSKLKSILKVQKEAQLFTLEAKNKEFYIKTNDSYNCSDMAAFVSDVGIEGEDVCSFNIRYLANAILNSFVEKITITFEKDIPILFSSNDGKGISIKHFIAPFVAIDGDD